MTAKGLNCLLQASEDLKKISGDVKKNLGKLGIWDGETEFEPGFDFRDVSAWC